MTHKRKYERLCGSILVKLSCRVMSSNHECRHLLAASMVTLLFTAAISFRYIVDLEVQDVYSPPTLSSITAPSVTATLPLLTDSKVLDVKAFKSILVSQSLWHILVCLLLTCFVRSLVDKPVEGLRTIRDHDHSRRTSICRDGTANIQATDPIFTYERVEQ